MTTKLTELAEGVLVAFRANDQSALTERKKHAADIITKLDRAVTKSKPFDSCDGAVLEPSQFNAILDSVRPCMLTAIRPPLPPQVESRTALLMEEEDAASSPARSTATSLSSVSQPDLDIAIKFLDCKDGKSVQITEAGPLLLLRINVRCMSVFWSLQRPAD